MRSLLPTLTICAILLGWTGDLRAQTAPVEVQSLEESGNSSEAEEKTPEGCGDFNCGTAASQIFCGECSDSEQCQWDGSNGTAGTCVPGTFGDEIQDNEDALNPLLVAPPKPTAAPVAIVPERDASTSTTRDWSAFAGSSISLRNIVSAISTMRDAEPDYNPYYGLSLGLAPRWKVLKKTVLAASFGLDRELTRADSTTKANETVYSDIGMSLSTTGFIELPMKLKLSGDLGMTLPISKYSKARSLQFALKPGLSLSRSYKVLAGLRTGYSLRVSKNFHEYTTGQRDVPLIPQCDPLQSDCDRFSNTGIRNASWQLSQALSLGLDIRKGLGVRLSAAAITSFLYPWESDDPRLSFQPQEPTDTRHLFAYGLEVYKQFNTFMNLGLGMSTVNPQLAPDSSYYAPFVNRYSNLYFDINIDVIECVTHFSRPE